MLGDQDCWGTNRLSKAESILGTGNVPKSITRPKTRLMPAEMAHSTISCCSGGTSRAGKNIRVFTSSR